MKLIISWKWLNYYWWYPYLCEGCTYVYPIVGRGLPYILQGYGISNICNEIALGGLRSKNNRQRR